MIEIIRFQLGQVQIETPLQTNTEKKDTKDMKKKKIQKHLNIISTLFEENAFFFCSCSSMNKHE